MFCVIFFVVLAIKTLSLANNKWLVGTAAAPVTKLYSTTTFDLLGKYHVSKNIHVNFNIDNLTNRYAFDPGTVIYMPIPGRTFRLGVEATF